MISIKWKFFLILVLSVFATAGAGFYITQHQTSTTVLDNGNEQPQQFSNVQHAQDIAAYPERDKYQTIPLESLKSALQGSDPTTLALNAFADQVSVGEKPKIEVVYPQQNQALVKITHIPPDDDVVDVIKYRVEMTTFGRSLLVSSPLVWQIVWAGSQIQCRTGSRPHKELTQSCQ
ncbi:hypothetical protein IQ243_16330 [Nostocales cyanobacterium LEGE 11386]|nr:hypothetical protein [Nostocales cyanobacterium LEGE 11386]